VTSCCSDTLKTRYGMTSRNCTQNMGDHNLSRSQYEALTRAFKPICPGCLDMNPTIFDWRAVRWAKSYPNLDPQKIVIGADYQCSSCMIIKTAFQSIGLDLNILHNTQYLSLHNKEEKGSLLASAAFDEGRSVIVELYTVPSKSLHKQHSHSRKLYSLLHFCA
jgi:hypothetical protein